LSPCTEDSRAPDESPNSVPDMSRMVSFQDLFSSQSDSVPDVDLKDLLASVPEESLQELGFLIFRI
jgi:hypothetical protein